MKRISPLLLLLLLVLAVAPLPARSRKKAPRTIREAAPVLVEAPDGTAPRLPYQVWVTYADRSGEWRQVKWTNSLRETEEERGSAMIQDTDQRILFNHIKVILFRKFSVIL